MATNSDTTMGRDGDPKSKKSMIRKNPSASTGFVAPPEKYKRLETVTRHGNSNRGHVTSEGLNNSESNDSNQGTESFQDVQSANNGTELGLSRFIHQSYSSQHKRSELEVYLEDPFHPENDNDAFDIIAWWKLHGLKYPIIARIARDILSVPVSTVASESAFSIAKRVLDEHRCSLLPQTVESLMCTQDWLKDIPDESRMGSEDIFPSEALSSPINEKEHDQSADAFLGLE